MVDHRKRGFPRRGLVFYDVVFLGSVRLHQILFFAQCKRFTLYFSLHGFHFFAHKNPICILIFTQHDTYVLNYERI